MKFCPTIRSRKSQALAIRITLQYVSRLHENGVTQIRQFAALCATEEGKAMLQRMFKGGKVKSSLNDAKFKQMIEQANKVMQHGNLGNSGANGDGDGENEEFDGPPPIISAMATTRPARPNAHARSITKSLFSLLVVCDFPEDRCRRCAQLAKWVCTRCTQAHPCPMKLTGVRALKVQYLDLAPQSM
mmetsp:Transcript_39304/g.91057  ORF Transcript_39304/g.91057 Transcript_39304/m.91057 type:complete len:187 (-) Transcript_39304:468-1028(-)